MRAFVRIWIRSLAAGVFFFGILIASFSLWTIFEERNLATTPELLDTTQLNHSGKLVYATINGGTLDPVNTYSYEIKRRRRSRAPLTTKYYIPVLNDNNLVAYILETSVDPITISFGKTLSNTGLLQPKSKIPQRIQDNYENIHGDQKYVLLDSSYRPKGILEKLAWVFVGLIAATTGFVIRELLSHR